MEIKILQVFLGADGLPYKDQERTVHFPIVGSGFQGASNTTKIRFYYDKLVEQDDTETNWVACAKLPNGKIGSKVLETDYDSTLGEYYALLELDSFYFQYKGDVYISLQGYQGGVQVSYDEETELYTINGTPTIASTGSIKLSVNYATQFVGSGETSNVNFQRILADLGTKLGIRAQSEHVEELPSVGQNDIFYVVNDDPNDPNLQNIYVWNENTQSYVWVGDNTLDLGDYYTQSQGEQFEEEIDNRVTSVENELSSVAQGSPKGVYATLADLQAAYPTGTTGIYVISGTGHWYYWNGSAWTDGGVYQATAINDNSIDWYKTNFVTRGKNLYNKDTALSGYYIGYTSGGAFANAGFFASDFIPIDATQGYLSLTPYSSFQMAFYDATKTYITGDYYYNNYPTGVVPIPSNAKFVRFSLVIGNKDKAQIEYGQTPTSFNNFYLDFKYPKPLNEILPDYSLEWFKTNFVTRGKNLYNKENAQDGYYVSYANGGSAANAAFFLSEYILIDPSKGYVTVRPTDQFQLAFYDQFKTYISGAYYGNASSGTVAIPNNAVYVRFSARIECKNYAQLEYGQSATELEEYYIDFTIPWTTINDKIQYKKIISTRQVENLINYEHNTPDKYYGSPRGTNNGSGCYLLDDLIQLKPNTKYSIYPKTAFYDAFTWLSQDAYGGDYKAITNEAFNYSSQTGTFTTDATHIYLRATTDTKPDEHMKLIEGDMPDNDIIYGEPMAYSSIEKRTFFVGADKQFTKLKDGVEYASKYPNAVLCVEEGTYDLVSEYGAETLESTSTITGLILKNGLHIIFSPKAKVTFNYTGSNSYIHTDFSPFNTGEYGGTIENLDLECSNCRYGIHDERGISRDRYVNRFINCRIKVDNSQNPDWSNPQNIGGGLGTDGYIEIIGCVFNHAVTYHNSHWASAPANSKSTVIIKDCYFENYGISINGYTASITAKSRFVITNNSLKVLECNDTIPNVEMFAWNNEIRS